MPKRNLTLAIETELLERAKVLAVRRKTTVTRLVRDYLQSLVANDTTYAQTCRDLKALMKAPPLRVGKARWTRDELHER